MNWIISVGKETKEGMIWRIVVVIYRRRNFVDDR
jgi:hypothetical protein